MVYTLESIRTCRNFDMRVVTELKSRSIPWDTLATRNYYDDKMNSTRSRFDPDLQSDSDDEAREWP